MTGGVLGAMGIPTKSQTCSSQMLPKKKCKGWGLKDQWMLKSTIFLIKY